MLLPLQATVGHIKYMKRVSQSHTLTNKNVPISGDVFLLHLCNISTPASQPARQYDESSRSLLTPQSRLMFHQSQMR